MQNTLSRSRSKKVRQTRRAFQIGSVDPLTAIFLAAVLVFGGAGNNSPLANAGIVLLGLAVCFARIPSVEWPKLDKGARCIAYLFIASIGLCLLQILPLPRGLWGGLPGHELAALIGTAVGGTGWTAWSVSPDRTLEALTALVPPAAGFLIALQASSEQRRDILRFILMMALVSAMLAILQLSAGPGAAPVLFDTRHRGFGVGLFVNRNHLALFLLLAILIASLPGITGRGEKEKSSRSVEWGLRSACLLLLSLGVLATLSRTGAFLLPITIIASILINRRNKFKWRTVVVGALLAGFCAFALQFAPPVQALFERYTTAADDKRLEFWANTLVAVRDAFPLGTGFGTFTLIYPTVEPLAELTPDIVNHAHNDFLELILEAGLLGVVLLIAWLAAVALLAVRAGKSAQHRRERLLPIIVAVATGLVLIASVVDYPLRMNTIAVTMGLLIGMLLPICQRLECAPSKRKWVLLVPLLFLAILTGATQAARSFFHVGGAVIAPWSAQLQSRQASHFQMAGDFTQASLAARRALAISPLDPQAVRVEGMSALSLGRSDQGAQLLSLGASLGWREGLNQLWLIDRAIDGGANAFAIERLDAMFRQHLLVDQLLPLMPGLLRTPDGLNAMAAQLATQPGWRVAFFNAFARGKGVATDQLLELGSRLRQAKAPLTMQDTSLIRAVLASEGRYREVRQVWLASGQQTLLGDGEFEAKSGELALGAAPYEWMAGRLTGVRVETAKAQVNRKGQALAITSQGLAEGLALSQTVVLSPGRYKLSFLVYGENMAVTHPLAVNVGCRIDTDRSIGVPEPVSLGWGKAAPGEWQVVAGGIVVPADCPAQTIMFSIAQTGGRPYSLWIDAVSVQPE